MGHAGVAVRDDLDFESAALKPLQKIVSMEVVTMCSYTVGEEFVLQIMFDAVFAPVVFQ